MRSNSTILRAEERSSDIFAAIDAVRDKLQRQIKRYKEKPIRVRERAHAAAQAAEPLPQEPGPRVVRTKRFVLRPMTEGEAIEQMELLGHDFFVFFNSTMNEINVALSSAVVEGLFAVIEFWFKKIESP